MVFWDGNNRFFFRCILFVWLKYSNDWDFITANKPKFSFIKCYNGNYYMEVYELNSLGKIYHLVARPWNVCHNIFQVPFFAIVYWENNMYAIIALLFAAIQWESRIVIAIALNIMLNIMFRAIVNILFLHIFVIISTKNICNYLLWN